MKITLFLATAVFSTVLMNRVPEKETSGGDANHGRYLTERALMCIQCHSPRGEQGDLLQSQLFMGAPIPVSPPSWAKNWALVAPRIAGMPGYAENEALKLLVTGIARTGEPPRSPMPPFRLNTQDARDIYAFLSQLGS
jgi:mono/diheme cytochrome c family protein